MSPERKTVTKYLCILAIFVSSEDVYGAKHKIPDFVTKCSLSAPVQLGVSCIDDNIEVIRSKLAQGIPEFRIPPMDPLFLESVIMTSPNFLVEFVNGSVTGATNFDLLNGTYDRREWLIRLDVRFHAIRLDGIYHVSGKLLMMQLEGRGAAWLNASNIEASIEMRAKVREDQDRKYLDYTDKSQHQIKIIFNETPVMYFDNLFPDNEELTKTTNALMNDNIMDIISDMMPIVEEIIGTFVFNAVETVFKLFSIDELFLP